MTGFVGRFVAAIAGSTSNGQKTANPGKEGVVWVTRGSCRTCSTPIPDPSEAPTAADPTDPIANSAAGDDGQPRSTFCSVECRDEFMGVVGSDR